jgi:hypothetical protein
MRVGLYLPLMAKCALMIGAILNQNNRNRNLGCTTDFFSFEMNFTNYHHYHLLLIGSGGILTL